MTKTWNRLAFFQTAYPSIKQFINEQVDQGRKILPIQIPPTQLRPSGEWQGPTLFNAFIATPRDQVKVIILGQDPYPNRDHAMGLAFSIPENVTPYPPSLMNIYKELHSDLGIRRKNGSLIDWAKQGVLLLNTALTVEEGKPNSHADIGWAQLAKEVVKDTTKDDHMCFVFWGQKAQAFEKYVDNDEHLVIRSAHPSPLSADKGFFGSKPFSKINSYLEVHNKAPIKW